MVLFSPLWSCILLNGPVWYRMVRFGSIQYYMVPYDSVLSRKVWMLPYGVLWYCMVPYGSVWSRMVSDGPANSPVDFKAPLMFLNLWRHQILADIESFAFLLSIQSNFSKKICSDFSFIVPKTTISISQIQCKNCFEKKKPAKMFWNLASKIKTSYRSLFKCLRPL